MVAFPMVHQQQEEPAVATLVAQEEEMEDTKEAKEVTKDGPKEERIRAVTQEARPQVKQDRDSFPTVRDPAINAEAKAT